MAPTPDSNYIFRSFNLINPYKKLPKPEDIKWRKKHEDCPGRIVGNNECRLSKNYCTQKNCIFEYFKKSKTGKTIDELFEI